MEEITFSIIIPTYNRAEYISKTISSLLNQGYGKFEVIIVDDGSNDNTEQVIKNFSNSKLNYYKVVNGERGRARNIGILNAKGNYVTFIDSDDIAYPNHLSEAVQLIKQHPGVEMFHLAYEMKDTDGNTIVKNNKRSGDLGRKLLNGNLFSCIGVFLRQDIARQNLFEEDRNLAGTEDWQLWLRLAARFPIYYSNTITACMINYKSRSVFHYNKESLIYRTKLLIDYLAKDNKFIEAFGTGALRKIEAHMFTYIALHSVLAQNNMVGLQFLLNGISKDWSELFQRRTLAILKNILKNLLPGFHNNSNKSDF